MTLIRSDLERQRLRGVQGPGTSRGGGGLEEGSVPSAAEGRAAPAPCGRWRWSTGGAERSGNGELVRTGRPAEGRG